MTTAASIHPSAATAAPDQMMYTEEQLGEIKKEVVKRLVDQANTALAGLPGFTPIATEELAENSVGAEKIRAKRAAQEAADGSGAAKMSAVVDFLKMLLKGLMKLIKAIPVMTVKSAAWTAGAFKKALTPVVAAPQKGDSDGRKAEREPAGHKEGTSKAASQNTPASSREQASSPGSTSMSPAAVAKMFAPDGSFEDSIQSVVAGTMTPQKAVDGYGKGDVENFWDSAVARFEEMDGSLTEKLNAMKNQRASRVQSGDSADTEVMLKDVGYKALYDDANILKERVKEAAQSVLNLANAKYEDDALREFTKTLPKYDEICERCERVVQGDSDSYDNSDVRVPFVPVDGIEAVATQTPTAPRRPVFGPVQGALNPTTFSLNIDGAKHAGNKPKRAPTSLRDLATMPEYAAESSDIDDGVGVDDESESLRHESSMRGG